MLFRPIKENRIPTTRIGRYQPRPYFGNIIRLQDLAEHLQHLGRENSSQSILVTDGEGEMILTHISRSCSSTQKRCDGTPDDRGVRRFNDRLRLSVRGVSFHRPVRLLYSPYADFDGLLVVDFVTAEGVLRSFVGSFLNSISASSSEVTKPTISAIRASSRRQWSVSSTEIEKNTEREKKRGNGSLVMRWYIPT